ncbi:MAG: cobalt transporter CbiM [Candidatus Omnitrophica bacterium]|nr:cobalt transporter CbiM [Candidatus Omnitrophota bacterium]MCM8809636.1 cobalt transporter CbiM [Candidatus Omnitrophota bacterium]
MHISEGILSGQILGIGASITLAGTFIGLKDLKFEDYPKVSLLSSAFFVASLIHIPIGPTSTHLVLNGLVGIILGWKSFPSILLALFLQAILFQFGGLTSLGVNTANMAIPAVISYYLFRPFLKKNYFFSGFLSGFFSIIFSCFLVAFSLYFTEKYFINLAKTIFIAHIPVSIVEGIITGFILTFLNKTKKEIIWGEK